MASSKRPTAGGQGSTWSVVKNAAWQAIFDEFVAFYLSQGAESLFLFFDNPAYANGVASTGNVIDRVCSNEYWTNGKGEKRPEGIERRQYHNHGVA